MDMEQVPKYRELDIVELILELFVKIHKSKSSFFNFCMLFFI